MAHNDENRIIQYEVTPVRDTRRRIPLQNITNIEPFDINRYTTPPTHTHVYKQTIVNAPIKKKIDTHILKTLR